MEAGKIPVETPRGHGGNEVRLNPGAKTQVHLYLLERSDVYRRLEELRNLGWNSSAGDAYFKRQREQADKATENTARHFFWMMQKIAREINDATDLFNITISKAEVASVLDWCMAPGGFLKAILQHNRGARCRAFSLPCENGGHKVFLSTKEKADIRFLDLNFLAADMGVGDIPLDHPEAQSFLPRHVEPGEFFDLVICDGQVLRTHKRPEHRERLESTRLVLVQLALGLEHVREGGKMVILLHRVESWDGLRLLYTFSKFSSVQLFKPRTAHKKKSTCYLVASDIDSKHEEAIKAVCAWKEAWKVATFGTLDQYKELVRPSEEEVEEVLTGFGPRLIEMAADVWEVQAEALEAAPWMKKLVTSPLPSRLDGKPRVR